MEELPFFRTIYKIDNSENYYQNSFKKLQNLNRSKDKTTIFHRSRDLLDYSILTKSILSEFGLYPIKQK